MVIGVFFAANMTKDRKTSVLHSSQLANISLYVGFQDQASLRKKMEDSGDCSFKWQRQLVVHQNL